MKQIIKKYTVKFKEKIFFIFQKYKKKIFIGIGVLLAIILLSIFFKMNASAKERKNAIILNVTETNLVSTVKASGSVTSIVDLPLSFKKSDLVEEVYVKIGDKVKKGQILATLKNQNERGVVTQARGNLARVMEGSSSEERKVAEVLLQNAKIDLENVKKQQDLLVENARRALFSASLVALPDKESALDVNQNPTVFGTYTGQNEGRYVVKVYNSSGGYSFNVSGLGNGTGLASINTFTPIGSGLSLQFPQNFSSSGNGTWNIDVPNKNSPSYTLNKNAYEAALQAREAAISNATAVVLQREAELALKKAPPRNADVLTAQGQLENALGSYENTVIRAPADGVVTKVDIKPGELAQALTPYIVIQDTTLLYVEANINESNITNIKTFQPVTFTIDAFGSERMFTGTVVEVDSAPTIKDGIVNYKIKASLDDNDPQIKTGMNANLTITTSTKQSVLSVSGAGLIKKENKIFVRKVTNLQNKKFKEVEVKTGITGDGNMVEVLEGLSLGDSILLLEKK